MNKDFKKILILWIISIIVSWLWIYSMRDIKFSNTKKKQKEAELKEQQSITNEYNELLNEYNSIVNSNTQSDIKEQPEDNKPITWEISLLIPWLYDNEWFSILTDKLSQENITLKIEKIDSLSEYKNTIEEKLNDYDIVLTPINWTKNLETEDINIWENIKPYFHELFDKYLSSTGNKIIPFSIDPAITLYREWITTQDSRNKIFSYVLLRNTQKKYAFPIVWWYDNIIENMISSWIEPFENYKDLLYLQQRQAQEMWTSEQNDMINTNNLVSTSKYTYINQKNIINILKNQNEYCEIFPSTCIMLYWYADIKFWYLTDLDIIDKYFSKNNLYTNTFTNTKYSYPARWRVFIVPKWNTKTDLVNKFFSKYISEWIDWTPFWNHTLSAISSFYDEQKKLQEYNFITANEWILFIYN